MILSSFEYSESNWKLTNLSPLHSLCLLVGRNSSGKTRAIHALQNVVSFMQMKQMYLGGSSTFSAKMSFSGTNDNPFKMEYSFGIKNGLIDEETLLVNEMMLIERTPDSAKYKSEAVHPPVDKLIVQTRRDKYLYPEIEQLMTWAEGVICISCSDINPFTLLAPSQLINPFSFSYLVDSLNANEKEMVMADASKLDYHISSIETLKANDNIRLVQIQEQDVSENIFDMQLSSGMLRSLYLLCFMQFIKNTPKVSMLLIDDMSEGLDYLRSTQLGRMILEDCSNFGIQLIASSNDCFLMDVVDISNWQVLRRVGSVVSVINQQTHPELFRKFKMTGLSNFDFFSSDFIDKYISREKRNV